MFNMCSLICEMYGTRDPRPSVVARTFLMDGTEPELKSVNADTRLHMLETMTLFRIAD
jgi:hypothetical protein